MPYSLICGDIYRYTCPYGICACTYRKRHDNTAVRIYTHNRKGQYFRIRPVGIYDAVFRSGKPFLRAWADTSDTIKNIQYPMLADAAHALAKDFDVLIEEAGLSERGTCIVNPEGKIVAYEVVAGNIGRNADELLRRVEALQFVAEHVDQVCPAKWQPGAETLKPGLDLIGKL